MDNWIEKTNEDEVNIGDTVRFNIKGIVDYRSFYSNYDDEDDEEIKAKYDDSIEYEVVEISELDKPTYIAIKKEWITPDDGVEGANEFRDKVWLQIPQFLFLTNESKRERKLKQLI